MPDPTIDLLRNLIAIDSVNPSLALGAVGESEIGEYISKELRASGMDVEVQPVADGRANVIGVIQGTQKGRTLMLCGHMDTVGVAGMQSPFDPVQKDGRVYGRGSQDMKGGLASMIAAAKHFSSTGSLRSGRLVLAAVIDEEYGSIGAEALVTKYKADAAVVGEPTDMKIALGHKGFEWVEVTTQGIAAHGSRPADGRDAIMRMGRVLSRLEKLDRELQSRPPHPIHGTASLHASIIDGGRELSTYPDRCVLKLEWRTIHGEPSHCGHAEVEKIIEQLREEDREFAAAAHQMFSRPAYLTPSDAGAELTNVIASAIGRKGVQATTGGMSFWTDAAILGAAGIPSVLFGPGGAGLHSLEEYVTVNEVTICRDALASLAKTWP